MSCDSNCSVAVSGGAEGWSAMCSCGISWSYLLVKADTGITIKKEYNVNIYYVPQNSK